mmetsp:Transcript_13724/g.23361  ORF Transcript_13724/g.23361 Transcript_13724/m.23361 type:complete len:530 (+) Transcript_13724:532-2121(+)
MHASAIGTGISALTILNMTKKKESNVISSSSSSTTTATISKEKDRDKEKEREKDKDTKNKKSSSKSREREKERDRVKESSIDLEDNNGYELIPLGPSSSLPPWSPIHHVASWLSDSHKLSQIRNLALLVIIIVIVQEMVSENNLVSKVSSLDPRNEARELGLKVGEGIHDKYAWKDTTGGDNPSRSGAGSNTNLQGFEPNDANSVESQMMLGGGNTAADPLDYLRQLQLNMATAQGGGLKRRADGELDEETDNTDIFDAGRAITGNFVFAENQADDKTTRIAQILAGIIQVYNISSLVDITCRYTANFTSQLHVRLISSNPEFKYFCIDNNPVQLHEIIQYFPRYKNVYFLRRHIWDRQFLKIPEAQLYFAFDGLQRYSFARNLEIFRNMKENNVKYFLTTINPNRKNPSPGSKYKYSRLDFHSEPYNFPEPLRRFSDLTNDPAHISNPKQLSLWRLQDITFGDPAPGSNDIVEEGSTSESTPGGDSASSSHSADQSLQQGQQQDLAEGGMIGRAASMNVPENNLQGRI